MLRCPPRCTALHCTAPASTTTALRSQYDRNRAPCPYQRPTQARRLPLVFYPGAGPACHVLLRMASFRVDMAHLMLPLCSCVVAAAVIIDVQQYAECTLLSTCACMTTTPGVRLTSSGPHCALRRAWELEKEPPVPCSFTSHVLLYPIWQRAITLTSAAASAAVQYVHASTRRNAPSSSTLPTAT